MEENRISKYPEDLSGKNIYDNSSNIINREKSTIDIVVPTLNEEKTIGQILEKISLYADKIIVIDGGSIDDTVKIATKYGAEVIHQNGNGKGNALIHALSHVTGDIIIFIDGDGSMRPEEIPAYIKGICSGADIVKGSRFLTKGGSEDLTMIRKVGNALFVLLVNILYRSYFTDLCYGFIALRKNAANNLKPILRSQGFDIETEIIIKSRKLGMKIVEVPSYEIRRKFGQSNLNAFSDGLKILSTIIREYIS